MLPSCQFWGGTSEIRGIEALRCIARQFWSTREMHVFVLGSACCSTFQENHTLLLKCCWLPRYQIDGVWRDIRQSRALVACCNSACHSFTLRHLKNSRATNMLWRSDFHVVNSLFFLLFSYLLLFPLPETFIYYVLQLWPLWNFVLDRIQNQSHASDNLFSSHFLTCENCPQT